MKWLKDLLMLLKLVRDMRKTGNVEALVVMHESDYKKMLQSMDDEVSAREAQNAQLRKEAALAQKCVAHMIGGGSACEFCEDREGCNHVHDKNNRGCSEWWLRFLTEEERQGVTEAAK